MFRSDKCVICTRPDANAIDAALIANQTLAVVAEQYSVSRSALGRHRQNHLRTITRINPKADLATQAAAWLQRANEIYEEAVVDADTKAQLAAITGALRALEIASRAASRDSGSPLQFVGDPSTWSDEELRPVQRYIDYVLAQHEKKLKQEKNVFN
jgi:hypothetical protein